jgi:hypothetical protein
MRLLRTRPPMQLLWITWISSVIVALSAAAMIALSWRLPAAQRLPTLIKCLWVAIILLCYIASTLAESALRKGVAANQWAEELLVRQRGMADGSLISALGWFSIVAAFVVIVLDHRWSVSAVPLLFAPQMSLSQVRLILRPQNTEADIRGTIYPAKPLHSEHWGEPPHPFSN